jgi:hypothetical protein
MTELNLKWSSWQLTLLTHGRKYLDELMRAASPVWPRDWAYSRRASEE